MNEEQMMNKIERAFKHVFKGRLKFRSDLERDNVRQWDSLKHVELMIALENLFGVRFDGADATAMISVPNIVDVLRRNVD